jgi:hypothetical protein
VAREAEAKKGWATPGSGGHRWTMWPWQSDGWVGEHGRSGQASDAASRRGNRA